MARRAARARQSYGASPDALLPDGGDIEAYTQGADGPRRDDLHAHAAALRRLPGCRRLRRAARPDASPSCRRRVRARCCRSARVTVLLLERDGDVLLERRPALGIWGGLWSLPEIPRDTDVRRVRRRASRGYDGRAAMVATAYARLHAFRVDDAPGPRGGAGWPLDARMPGVEWFARDAALAAAIPAPIRKLLRIGDASEFRLTG